MNSAASAGGKPPGIHRTIRRGQDDPVSTRRSDNWKDIARPWAWTIATAAILVIGGANNTYPCRADWRKRWRRCCWAGR